MRGLCTGVGRHDGQLHLEIRSGDGDEQLYDLIAGREFTFETAGARRCIGFRRPDDNALVPCPNSITDLGRPQCDDCLTAAFILPCLLCAGERCGNPLRRGSCVRPANHITYLASFGPGIIKVGVARWERRLERLIEQGARTAIAIARDDGQQVRRLETHIKKHIKVRQNTRDGIVNALIPDRLAPTSKLWAYTQASGQMTAHDGGESRQQQEIAALRAELMDVLVSAVKPRVRAQWLSPAEALDLPPLPFLSQEPRLLQVRPHDRMRATLVAVLGQTLLLDADTGEQLAMDAGSLVGYDLRPLDAHEHGEDQLSLGLL
jgi:hypothetical protein